MSAVRRLQTLGIPKGAPFRRKGAQTPQISHLILLAQGKTQLTPGIHFPICYYFYIDFIGHIDDAVVKDALADLENERPLVRWLGSYPDSKL